MLSDKIVWVEGMLLGPQHFQQWDKYHEMQQQRRFYYSAPNNWGLVALDIDSAALLHGVFVVKKVEAWLENGACCYYEDGGDNSLSYKLDQKCQTGAGVFLAMAHGGLVKGIAGYPNPSTCAPLQAQYCDVADSYDSSRKREVLTAKIKLQLLLEGDEMSCFCVLKIAQIQHLGHGQYRLVQDFIPTVLHLRASTVLYSKLQQFKIGVQSSLNKLDEDNVKILLLRQELSRLNQLLQYFYQQPICHPQQIYMSVVASIGALQALCSGGGQLPNMDYAHEDLSATFNLLLTKYMQLIECLLPERLPKLHLTKIDSLHYEVLNIPEQYFASHAFVLEVEYVAESDGWAEQLVSHIKIGEQDMIDNIMRAALPGVVVQYLKRLPQSLVAKADCEYFLLQTHGACWQAVVAHKNLKIFVGQMFAAARFELITISEKF